jgi:acetolactate synthase-1/2/3 large subunit
MARSADIDGVRVDKAAELGGAIEHAVKLNKPFLIDANIGADMNPGGAGVWELAGLGYKQPAIGGRCDLY